MNNSNCCLESLYDLTLKKLCRSMNEEILKYILQYYPPSIIFEVIWKILGVRNGTTEYNYRNFKYSDNNKSSISRGCEIAQMLSEHTVHSSCLFNELTSSETFEKIAKTQQITFVDKFNFCDYFNLDLFFKLIEVIECRNQLFTIFQICILKNGYTYPKQFAKQWIQRTQEDYDNETHFHNIEHGLKLGIFLGDSGWLSESALILSHTYKIITTKWMCVDQNLELIKIIQCLTKWLLVVSNYYDFDEAKVVLQLMIDTINILEKMEGRTLCIAYAYVAVSQYYYLLMELNEAWSWAVKAVYELHDRSGDVLKLLVISHTIRISSALNKLSTAKKLINQLHTYDKEIDQNIHVDMLLNEAYYSLKADLAQDSIDSYYIALDSRRNLFGYYNLHTAIVFVDYAYARYVCDYSTTNFNEAMGSILQGIFIMNKIGLPDDNMLLISAGRIKALILEEKALDLINQDIYIHDPLDAEMSTNFSIMKTNMLNEAEKLQSKALNVSLKAVGEKALLTAKSYCNLGRLYQSQEKYMQSEKMHLKAIEIKESILGKDNPEVALSLGHLASLYAYQLNRYKEAEQLYLRSKTIYETTYGKQYTGLLYDFQGLTKVYYKLNNIDKYNEYVDNIQRFQETRGAWLHEIHTALDINCTKDDLSLDKLRCILDECGCEKK